MPDLSFTALWMSKNSKDATISDIRDVNGIVTKVRECGSKVKYEHIRDKDDLRRVGIGGAFLKTGDRTIGGAILFWTNSSMTRASPIHWKAKQIDGVCHTSKDAETLNLLTMAIYSVYATSQLKQDTVCSYLEENSYSSVHRLGIDLESVASSEQIVARTLRTVSNLSFKSEERQCMASYGWG